MVFMEKSTILLFALIGAMILFMIYTCRFSQSSFGASKHKSSFDKNSEMSSLAQSIGKDSVLIFYAPWCGYCKKSMKEFEDAIAQGNGKIVLVDATNDKNASLVEQFSVKAFPTIVKGDGTVYSGDRTADSIVKFSK